MIRTLISLSLLVSTLLIGNSVSAQTIYPLNQQTTPIAGNTLAVPLNMGYQFRATVDGITVVKLGVFSPTGAPTAKTATLYDVATQQALGQVVCPANTGWQFADLATPIALVRGAEYMVVVLVGGAAGNMYSWTNAASWRPTGDIQWIGAATNGPNFPSTVTTSTSVYGLADIGYIRELIVATPSQLPDAVAGTPYVTNITADVGPPPYTWSHVSGSIPQGLSFTQVGDVFQLSGTPPVNANGNYIFDVMVTDNASATHTKTMNLFVDGLKVTTSAQLPDGQEAVSYSELVQATNGTTPYTWSMPFGSLPGGLTLTQSGNDYLLAGTPVAGTHGNYAFDVTVTDNVGTTSTQKMKLYIDWPPGYITYPLTEQTPSPSAGFTGVGAGFNTQYGWRFRANSDGLRVLKLGSNFPTAAAGILKVVTLFDYSTEAILAQVTCGPGTGWQWTDLTVPVLLDNGTEYVVSAHSTNGFYFNSSALASWAPTGDIEYLNSQSNESVNSSTFPSYETGTGLYPVQYGVCDIGYIKYLTIITDSQLPSAAENAVYNTSIQADFGTTPYTWTHMSGTLPNGLALTQVGDEFQLSGTLAAGTNGTHSFTVMVADSVNNTHTKQISLHVLLQSAISATLPFSDDFSIDQGWVAGGATTQDPSGEDQWNRGSAISYNPTTGVPRSEPGVDNTPSSTDNYIFGHIIGDDYLLNNTTWLTSPIIDCSSAATVSLRFYRWLGVSLDSTAVIEVTNNGIDWINVWTSPSSVNTNDTAWTLVDYDISAVAAGYSVIQVRFIMGPTSSSTFTVNTGWCIDDVEIYEPVPEFEVREGGLVGTLIVDDEAIGGLRDFGRVDSTGFKTVTFSMTNTSPNAINLSYAGIPTPTGEFYLSGGTLPTSLAPNTSTTFDIVFRSTTVGTFNATFEISHSGAYSGTGPFEINVEAESVVISPIIEVGLTTSGGANIPHLDPATIANTRDFGSVVVGNISAPIDIVITNTGLDPLTIDSISMQGTWHNQYSVSNATMPVVLAPNASTTFTVAFQPISIGVKDALVRIVHNDFTYPAYLGSSVWAVYEVPVEGVGANAVPLIDVSDGSPLAHNDPAPVNLGPRNFGDIVVNTISAPLTITISNNGGSDLIVNPPVLTTSAVDYALDLSNFPASGAAYVPASGSITFDVTFTPTSIGQKDAVIEFTHNDTATPNQNPFIINITGDGVLAAPVIEVSDGTTLLANPDTLDFGQQDVAAGPTAAIVITVENTGTAPLTLVSPTFNPVTSNFILNTTGFPSSLAIGASATFSIVFNPSQDGLLTAIVGFTHNDGTTGTPFVLNLTGTGLAPKVEVRENSTTGTVVASGAPASIGGGRDIGSVDISAGATGPITIVLTNSGSLNLMLGTPTLSGSNAADFILYTTGMASTLSVGSNTSFTVMFDPTLGGIKNAQIVFTHNDPTSPSPFIVPVTGTAVDPSGVQITTSSLPSGNSGVAYMATALSAIQGNDPYTWSVYSGNLPNGLTLSAGGVITGTPITLVTNTYNFTVRVADTTGATHERQLSIIVAGSAIVPVASPGAAGCVAGSSGASWLILFSLFSLIAVSTRLRLNKG